jgi:hypothetical protein
LLLRALGRRSGAGSLAGVGRAVLAGGLGALLGAGAGAALATLPDLHGMVPNGLLACAIGVVAAGVFAAVVRVLDADTVRALLRRRGGSS